eukprot:TRINITY_DN79122_c0_g1_i1.p1 TRINITY_DN79122_c0_g1~~TRINITY_DN79122_c0_g1_i1.p1  ORF type:complete len:129 (+),score=33.64 TRINITY_DN79122_c0_g1_i1:53-388(+)
MIIIPAGEDETPDLIVRQGVKCLEQVLGTVLLSTHDATINKMSNFKVFPKHLLRRFGELAELIPGKDDLDDDDLDYDLDDDDLDWLSTQFATTAKCMKHIGNTRTHSFNVD